MSRSSSKLVVAHLSSLQLAHVLRVKTMLGSQGSVATSLTVSFCIQAFMSWKVLILRSLLLPPAFGAQHFQIKHIQLAGIWPRTGSVPHIRLVALAMAAAQQDGVGEASDRQLTSFRVHRVSGELLEVEVPLQEARSLQSNRDLKHCLARNDYCSCPASSVALPCSGVRSSKTSD